MGRTLGSGNGEHLEMVAGLGDAAEWVFIGRFRSTLGREKLGTLWESTDL